MIKTAIVILNWNGIDYLRKFLKPLDQYTNNNSTAIFIADNGSNDDSIKFIEENYPEINIIKFDKNYGFAEGYNKALEKINAEYYILLNSDVEVTKNWISPIINLMDYDKNIAACMPKIKSFKNREYFEYAGAAGGFIDKYAYPFCRGRIINTVEKDDGQYNNSSEVFWASGACLFIRANLFIKAGGFDPSFFAHMEEIDLCWRLKNMGYKIMYSPGSTIYHVGGGTLTANDPKKIYLNFRNSLFMLYKNHTNSGVAFRLSIRMIFDGMAAISYLFSFRLSFFCSVMKAHFDFYCNYRKLKEKRKKIMDNNFPIKHKQIYNSSIILNYYLYRKKIFSKLKL